MNTDRIAVESPEEKEALDAIPSCTCAKDKRIAELELFNRKLLRELCDIQSQCIGEIAMGFNLDSQSIGQSISSVTGMAHPELVKYLERK